MNLSPELVFLILIAVVIYFFVRSKKEGARDYQNSSGQNSESKKSYSSVIWISLLLTFIIFVVVPVACVGIIFS